MFRLVSATSSSLQKDLLQSAVPIKPCLVIASCYRFLIPLRAKHRISRLVIDVFHPIVHGMGPINQVGFRLRRKRLSSCQHHGDVICNRHTLQLPNPDQKFRKHPPCFRLRRSNALTGDANASIVMDERLFRKDTLPPSTPLLSSRQGSATPRVSASIFRV